MMQGTDHRGGKSVVSQPPEVYDSGNGGPNRRMRNSRSAPWNRTVEDSGEK